MEVEIPTCRYVPFDYCMKHTHSRPSATHAMPERADTLAFLHFEAVSMMLNRQVHDWDDALTG